MAPPIKSRVDGYTSDAQALGRLRRSLEKDKQFPEETRNALIFMCDVMISLILTTPERGTSLLHSYAQEMADRYGSSQAGEGPREKI